MNGLRRNRSISTNRPKTRRRWHKVASEIAYMISFSNPFTIKQWSTTPDQIGPEVTARISVRNNRDNRYFGDVFLSLLTHGYTNISEKMFDNPLIKNHTNVDYFELQDQLKCGHTYFSRLIDHYFAHLGYEELEYHSLKFERRVERKIGEASTSFCHLW